MRVDEYLHHRAAPARGRRGERRTAASTAPSRSCGLGDRRRQIIGTLSRGYRQRVGLADAILARPPILILDEPTVGLDPNQIREVRALVRDAGARRDRVAVDPHPVRGRGAGGARDHPASRPGGRGARRTSAARLAGARARHRQHAPPRLASARWALRAGCPPSARSPSSPTGGWRYAAARRSRRGRSLRERSFVPPRPPGWALRELRRENPRRWRRSSPASPPAARTRPMRNVPAVARRESRRVLSLAGRAGDRGVVPDPAGAGDSGCSSSSSAGPTRRRAA